MAVAWLKRLDCAPAMPLWRSTILTCLITGTKKHKMLWPGLAITSNLSSAGKLGLHALYPLVSLVRNIFGVQFKNIFVTASHGQSCIWRFAHCTVVSSNMNAIIRAVNTVNQFCRMSVIRNQIVLWPGMFLLQLALALGGGDSPCKYRPTKISPTLRIYQS